MKIALVTDSFTMGGGLEHIYQICLGMPDIDFGVFAKDGNAKEKFELLPNVKIFSSGYDEKYIKSFNPDIVHIHHLKPLAKLYKIDAKTIFTVHGVHLHKYEFMSGFKAKVLRFLRLNLEKYLYKSVDKIITVSDDDKAFLKEYYKVDSEVIYNGIDYRPIEQIVLSKEELRDKLNIPKDKQIYLTVARFDFPKGYDILINAIKILKDKKMLKNKLFLFVGDGELTNEMKNLVDESELNENIIFMGKRTDVYELMKTADCFILPSRWEGFPITLIEAMACNLPIIASNTYGNRTVKSLEQNINLFDNLDSLDLSKKILEFKDVKYSVILSIKKMVLNTKGIYESI
jgi:glycosyltransferase involved in cell wall biosynthesis